LTCDIIAFIALGFSFIFFLTNGVYRDMFKKPQKDEDPIFNKLAQEMIMKMS